MSSKVALTELKDAVRKLAKLYNRALLQQYFRGLAKHSLSVPYSVTDIALGVKRLSEGTMARTHPIRLAVATLAYEYLNQQSDANKGDAIHGVVWEEFYNEFDNSSIAMTPEYGVVHPGTVPKVDLLEFAEQAGVCWMDGEEGKEVVR